MRDDVNSGGNQNILVTHITGSLAAPVLRMSTTDVGNHHAAVTGGVKGKVGEDLLLLSSISG